MKQSEKTAITNDRIMAAAMDEFGEKGYAGASLNNICAAGIPKGSLYHNFRNKDELYLACVGRCFSALTDSLGRADTDGDLRKYMAARLDFFKSNQNEAHIFFDAVLQPADALRGPIEELRAGFDEFNRAVYRKALDALTLRRGVSEQDALDYFSMLQTMFNGYFSSPAFRDLSLAEKTEAHERRLERLLELLLYGVAEREAAL